LGRPIKKILIANRGEIAVRVIRTCREMGISTVAVFSDADRTMPHVLMADEAYHIGLSPAQESYLAMEKLIGAAKRSGADAIHPGYGFLAENADFAQKVKDEGIIFIGPPPAAIRAMGDKTEARKLAKSVGVPIVPGTVEPIKAEEEAREFLEQNGFPILIKAAAGGGGKGMRVVSKPEEFTTLFRAAQSEAASAFGDGRIYLEAYLKHPRHIEVQILADEFGNAIHLGERECSIQRRHQKVIEESPSVIVDDALRSTMGNTAVRVAKACGYVNAGTVEFLVDQTGRFYFLEMNTRIQVEHPVTELRTGIDLVAEQITIATGQRLLLSQDQVSFIGHSIECRIYAEDPQNNFMPSTGTITHLKSGQGFGVREDRGIEQGKDVSVYYDPMISKVIVWGRSRQEAIARMKRALQEYEILGVTTNIPLNLFVLNHPKFRTGEFDTHFLDEYWTSRPDDLNEAEKTAAVAVGALCNAEQLLTKSISGSHTQFQSSGGSDTAQRGNTHSKWLHQRNNAMRE